MTHFLAHIFSKSTTPASIPGPWKVSAKIDFFNLYGRRFHSQMGFIKHFKR